MRDEGGGRKERQELAAGGVCLLGGRRWEWLVGCWMLDVGCRMPGRCSAPSTSFVAAEAVKKQEQGIVVVGEAKMTQPGATPMKPENIGSLDSLVGRVWLVVW